MPSTRLRADPVEIDIGRVGDPDSAPIDCVFAKIASVTLLRRRPAIADIVFDAEIAIGPAGIVARRQDDAAEGLVFADEVRGGRRREEAALADQHPAEAVRRRHADRRLDRLAVEVAPVAADHQGLAVEAVERVEDRLDEVLDIMRLLEDRHLLAQARGAGLLVVEGFGRNLFDHLKLAIRRRSCTRR